MRRIPRGGYRSLVVSITALVTSGVMCLLADDRVVAKSASPDKKWELRHTEIDEAAAANGVDSDRALVRAGTKKPLVELPLHVGDGEAADRETRLLWAPDSKRFAYNYRAGGRYETTNVYQLRNGKWTELRSLESKETSTPLKRAQSAQLAELKLPEDTDRRRIWDSWQVTRWEDARTAVLYAHSIEHITTQKDDDEEIRDLEAHFVFTIRFDDRGKWRVIKTHQMSEKEVAAQNASTDTDESEEE